MMKRMPCLSLLSGSIALPPQAAEDCEPKHGSVVVETTTGDMGLVVEPDPMVILAEAALNGKPLLQRGSR